MKYILSILFFTFFYSAGAQVNLSAGLLAYYPFSGNTNDASGNGYNAVNFGAVLTTDQGGNPNSAYYFDGINDYMRIANAPAFNILPQVSLAAKVKVQGFYNGNCKGNCIIDKGSNDYVPGALTLRFSPGNYTLSCTVTDTVHQNYYHLYNGVNTPTTLINNPPYIQKEQWDCVIYTYDGTTSKLYVNGVLRYQLTNPPATVSNTDDLFLGKKNDAQFPYLFKGVMDEVRIYNRALNVQEIDSLCSFMPPQDTVINKYAAVTDLQSCTNTITVDTATDFNAGDTILMIQMKGAVIDTSNTASFGTVLDYRGAGNYEYNVIKTKSGNDLTLKYAIIRNYEIPYGKVQIVRVPSFQKYTVNQPHTALPWNGSKGGVFAISVDDTLRLNDNISVDGKGFRGGQPLLSTQYSCNRTDYFYPSTNNYGAQKGEGIAEISAAKIYGRGSLANGGGGGNDHNAAGGGGGNAAAGGLGGNQFNMGGSCSPLVYDIGGRGGKQLAYNNTDNKIFPGGGGGAGHGNDLGEKPGAKGGGIVLIHAGVIARNAGAITANGSDATECSAAASGCQDDGTGGGGGGGAILLNANSIGGLLPVIAKGGKGADTWVSSGTSQVAPGGGGGGGVIWYSLAAIPAGTTNTLSGGANGVLPQFSNAAWGAQPGQPGQTLVNLQISFPTDTFHSGLVADFSDSVIDCFTRKFKDLSTGSNGIASRAWSFDNLGASSQQNPIFTFPGYGSYTVKLVVTNGYGCMDSITRNITIPYVHFADAGNDTSICSGKTARLQASGGVSYSWSPVAGLSDPAAPATDAAVSGSTTYIVTVTDSKGCMDKDTVAIGVSGGIPVSIVSDDNITIGCLDNPVALQATGAASYTWSPGIYCDDSTSASPRVKPPATTLFTVTGTDAGGCTSQDTITVSVYYGDEAVFMPNAFSPNNDGRNDEIGPLILCGFTMEQFAVFNRWGQRIFSTADPSVKWNGTYKNKPADTGTYYYFIKGKKENGATATFKGDLILIR